MTSLAPSLAVTIDREAERERAEDQARAAAVRLDAIKHLTRDDRDEDLHDAIGCVGFGHAPETAPPQKDLRAVCRRYLREWRQIKSGRPAPPKPAVHKGYLKGEERRGRPRRSQARPDRLNCGLRL